MSMPDLIEDALQLLRVEYLEDPDLLLNPGEAAELLDLDRAAALSVLEALEASGFLVLTSDGRFGRSSARHRPAPVSSPRDHRRAG